MSILGPRIPVLDIGHAFWIGPRATRSFELLAVVLRCYLVYTEYA